MIARRVIVILWIYISVVQFMGEGTTSSHISTTKWTWLGFFNHLDSTYSLLFPLNSCREWPHCIKTSTSMWKYPWALFRHSDLCQSTKQAISRFCFSNPSNHANPICIYRTFCPSFLSQRWHNSDRGHAVFRETLDLLYVSLDFDVREDQRELERRERESKSRREGRGQQSREGWEWQRKKVSMRWEVERERERKRGVGNRSKTWEAFTLDFALESNLHPAGEATVSKNQITLPLLTPAVSHTCAQPRGSKDLEF